MEETQGKKKRNKRSGGAYEHGLMTEYESAPTSKKDDIPYNDLPKIKMPDKNEDDAAYIEETQAESELSKLMETKICKEFIYFDFFKTA